MRAFPARDRSRGREKKVQLILVSVAAVLLAACTQAGDRRVCYDTVEAHPGEFDARWLAVVPCESAPEE